MATYYVNAESVTQDGLTPATGYHTFTALNTAYPAITNADTIYVVKTATPITETTHVALKAGLVAPYTTPLQQVNISAGFRFYLGSGTTMKGLSVASSLSTNGWLVQSLVANATDIVVDSCMFENTNVATTNAQVWISGVAGQNACLQITIKDCICWNFLRLCQTSVATYSAGQLAIFANNSFVSSSIAGQSEIIKNTNMETYVLNTAMKSSTINLVVSVAETSAGTVPHGRIDYWKTNRSSYTLIDAGAPHIDLASPAHNSFSLTNMFPATLSPVNKDFTLTPPSSLIDAGGASVTSAGGRTVYAPTYDILGKSKYGARDVGAYEYVPTCWSFTAKYKNTSKMFKMNGSENRHPREVKVPGNIDPSSICMMEHGKFIPPTEYKLL
jgi:hypothetical protein